MAPVGGRVQGCDSLRHSAALGVLSPQCEMCPTVGGFESGMQCWGDGVLPIDFNLKLGIVTPLSLLMKSPTLELILIWQTAGLDANCILEDGWLLVFHMIRSDSVTTVVCLC
jgi:hypothetical protein